MLLVLCKCFHWYRGTNRDY